MKKYRQRGGEESKRERERKIDRQIDRQRERKREKDREREGNIYPKRMISIMAKNS